jgi:hypothetical protein
MAPLASGASGGSALSLAAGEAVPVVLDLQRTAVPLLSWGLRLVTQRASANSQAGIFVTGIQAGQAAEQAGTPSKKKKKKEKKEEKRKKKGGETGTHT